MSLNSNSQQQSAIYHLHKNWAFTQDGKDRKVDDWLPCKHFPTTVHVELRERPKSDKYAIPDPFIGLSEWDVQWIGESVWKFKTTFQIESDLADGVTYALLRFDGLDTYCSIKLNGQELIDPNTNKEFSSQNQFIAYQFPVHGPGVSAGALRKGENELELTFPSAFAKGRELEKQYGKRNLWNGDSSRLYVRKAQYNYGWDWGPVLMTVGPWRPVILHVYRSRIDNLRTIIDVKEDFSTHLDVTFNVDGHDKDLTAECILLSTDGKEIRPTSGELKGREGRFVFELKLRDEDLWYPVGYGNQTLYTVKASLKHLGGVRDVQEKRIGFRRVRVVRDPLEGEDGHSFLFEINNIRIFCGGSNWIPADSFLTTMSRERYSDWLRLLVDGNQNMIRVWGGGIYEHDDFYDICDELGILVWQDFMFGCGLYPAHDEFLDLVKVEAEQNVKRLRHHPSIVLFAGNNEDYQIAESLGLVNYDDEQSDYRKSDFPARYTYEYVLADIVGQNCEIYYHRGSPYSGYGGITTDRTNGDLHQWNVWHGSQEPWHNWDILAGRFVSEFGMEAYPNIRTVDYWLQYDKNDKNADSRERYPQSRTNCNHNKADGFERRLELYLMENFKHAFDMESYVYFTQIMQAECLAAAYRLWRRNWKGKGKEYTAGALVWQLNDCWPVTSWAIADYFLRPKPAYFAIARELQPFTVGITRKEKKTGDTATELEIETELEIWGTNSQLEEKPVKLSLQSFDLNTSEKKDLWSKDVVLAPNASTEIWKGPVPGQPTRTRHNEVPKPIVIHARLVDGDNKVLARHSNWPEPYKYIHFPTVEQTGLKIEADGETVHLSSNVPIKGIVLDVEGEDVKWSDQAIDLFPGDEQSVKAKGLNGRTIRARYLGDGTA